MQENQFVEKMDIRIEESENKEIVIRPNYLHVNENQYKLNYEGYKQAIEKAQKYNNKIKKNLEKNAKILLLLYDIDMFLKKMKMISDSLAIPFKAIFKENCEECENFNNFFDEKELLNGKFKIAEANKEEFFEGNFEIKLDRSIIKFRENFFNNLMNKSILLKNFYSLLMNSNTNNSQNYAKFIKKFYLVVNGDLIESFNKAYEKKICNNMLECLNPLNWWNKNNTLYILITLINFDVSIIYGALDSASDDSINTLESSAFLCFMYLNFILRVWRVSIPQLNSVEI